MKKALGLVVLGVAMMAVGAWMGSNAFGFAGVAVVCGGMLRANEVFK